MSIRKTFTVTTMILAFSLGLASCAQGTSTDNSSESSTKSPTTTPATPAPSGITLSDITGTWVSTTEASGYSSAKGSYTSINYTTDKITSDGMWLSYNNSTRSNSAYGTWYAYSGYKAKISVSNSVLTTQITDYYSQDVLWSDEASIIWTPQTPESSSTGPIAIINGKMYVYEVYARQGSGTGITGTWNTMTSVKIGSNPVSYYKNVLIITDTTYTHQNWSNDPGTFTATPTTENYTYTYTNGILSLTTTAGTQKTTQYKAVVSGDVLAFGNGSTKIK